MKKIVAAGKTVEDAIQAGLNQLQTVRERVHIQVLEQPSKGLFGLFGVKDARVELELLPDALEEAVQFLQDVFEAMNLEVTIEQTKDSEGTLFQLSGPEMGIVIGRRGQTLDSLQYLTNIVANRYSDKFVRIGLDAEQFRSRRKQTLEELSERLARRVIKTRKEVVLEPMSSQERKIIHSALQNHGQVKTYSKGEEPNRRVVIAVK
ncbi:RNA-binding cell elongation regulator Jag/EloR [Paenibacillus sp. y28]|uniref:RNA-binding cell elongation regulator Jag/EloR n=1 Tax=Paenibacillus sp. y28 TaxID=3129110 RepID=UPI0030163446